MSIVKRTTSYTVVESGGWGRATFVYNDRAPYDVSVRLGVDKDSRPVEWMFARNLLADGLTGPSGYGDVRCVTGGIYYYVSLTSSEGHAILSFIAEEIRAFLIDAEDLVGYGAEVLDFDAELDALLKDGAR